MTAELRNMIVRLDENVAFEWPPASMTFAQISTFKGFENRFILVSDLDDVTGDPRTVASLYVAMSRARASLWLALTESAQERLLPVIAENASLVLGHLEEDEND
jgi:superfamily I DNA and RNA helicase